MYHKILRGVFGALVQSLEAHGMDRRTCGHSQYHLYDLGDEL